jgi:V8-like Glu-specific endopeptidase
MSVLTADERVSNSDLPTEEIEEAASFEGGGEHDEPGPGGLEAIAVDPHAPTASIIGEVAAEPPAPSLAGLRPAEEASYDVAGASIALRAESVIDEDERRRIENTDAYPWRVHAALRITARDGSRWIGTAFFIAPRVLATAGHNLFFHGNVEARRGWARTIEVMPGRNENDLPYGTAMSTSFHSVRGWTEPDSADGRPDPDYDYGVIVLDPDEALGQQTGWIGFGTYGDATLRSVTGNLSGYPADRGNGRQQWYMARRIDSLGTRRIYYDIDTYGGQSGSAVYRIKDGSRYAVGIHAYGVGERPLNSATRINRAVFDNLVAWKHDHQ